VYSENKDIRSLYNWGQSDLSLVNFNCTVVCPARSMYFETGVFSRKNFMGWLVSYSSGRHFFNQPRPQGFEGTGRRDTPGTRLFFDWFDCLPGSYRILVPRAYDLFCQRWDRRALVSAITGCREIHDIR